MLSADACGVVVEQLRREDFYKPANGEILSVIAELFAQGQPADAVTVADAVARRGMLDFVGGKPYLHTLVASVPTLGSVGHYARIVSDHARLRRLIDAGAGVVDLGYSLPADVDEACDQAEAAIFAAATHETARQAITLRQAVTQVLDRMDRESGASSVVTGVSTGLGTLDTLTAGLQRRDLVVIGARTSMGKSALAGGIAFAAARAGVPALVFSLEMSAEQLGLRLLAAEARLPIHRLQRGSLTLEESTRLSTALGVVAEAPMRIEDSAALTVMELRSRCRRVSATEGLGLVVIDYLQLMSSSGRAENRVQEVSEICRGLKVLAGELGVPVVALSQLSRNLEYRADKRPMLADLRESGDIEQSADVVLLIYRDEVYNPETPAKGVAELIVAKHRQGPTGTVKVGFTPAMCRFYDLAAAASGGGGGGSGSGGGQAGHR
jgi:replicative DNA helicase